MLVGLSDSLPSVGGALTDRLGRVVALWCSFSTQSGGRPSSFFAGLPVHHAREVLEALRSDEPWVRRDLGVELGLVSLARARDMGLSPADARALAEAGEGPRRVLSVRRVAYGTPAHALLQPGDLLLEVAGHPPTGFREVEEASRGEEVPLVLLRHGERLTRVVPTVARPTGGTRRALLWAGMLLQDPPEELAWQRGLPRDGVYVAGRWRGSPAERYGLRPTSRIVALDGQPVADLDAFLAAVGDRGDGESVRLRTVDLSGRVRVQTLLLDTADWPTEELVRGPDGWRRVASQRAPHS